jgi:caffeoyl-CoA O-methyltransferase/O-methyltransferase
VKPEYFEKFLPTQQLLRNLFSGSDEDLIKQMYRLSTETNGIFSPKQQFEIEESDQFSLVEMGSNPIQLCFLQFLVFLQQPQRVLEIGTFVGISTMFLARALAPGAMIDTIEKYDHFAGIARRNFQRNGLLDRIRLLEGDAFEILGSAREKSQYDFVFLDGNKERYGDYFLLLDPLVRTGGLLVVDDVFFHGDTLQDPPTTEKGRGVYELLKIVRDARQYQRALLPVGNGLLLLRKTSLCGN